MEHVVFFPAHDGTPAFRRLASLEEAVRLVEHLRNAEGVDHVSVHALTEVPLEFKAYYRVEMPPAVARPVEGTVEGGDPVAPVAEPAPVTAPEQSAVPAVEGVPAVPEQAEQPAVEAPAKASLGFFSRG